MLARWRGWPVLFGLILPGIALPLGLGELRLQSFLNEPLRAEVDLLDLGDLDPTQLRVRLATRADFERAGVERAHFLTGLNFSTATDSSGNNRLLISSRDSVLEPYLNFIIEARWPNGRILREYTVLLDLPVLDGPAGATMADSGPAPAGAAHSERAEQEAMVAGADRYGADADPVSAPGTQYLVQRGETLWRIASLARPQDSTIQQMMLDIRRLNPNAFTGGNINQLKAGYLLRLPTPAEMSDLDPAAAVAEVKQQERKWRENLATIEARDTDSTTGVDAGERAGGEPGGSLVITAGDDAQAGGAVAAGENANLDEIQRDNEELLGSIRSMEARVLTLERLLTLKDNQIAALQSALAGQASDTSTRIDEVEGTIDETPAPVADGLAVTRGQSVAPSTPPPVQSDLTMPPADNNLMAIMLDYLLPIVALLLLVTAGLFRFFRRRYRHRPASPDRPQGSESRRKAGPAAKVDREFAPVKSADDGPVAAEFPDQSADQASISGSFGLSATATRDEETYAAPLEAGDALAEAGIYIAYGRFPQAVDLLKAAISAEPVNVEYRLKLMEACGEMSDAQEMQQQYADLQVIGDPSALSRARELLEATDSGAALLQNLPKPTVSADEVTAAGTATATRTDAGGDTDEVVAAGTVVAARAAEVGGDTDEVGIARSAAADESINLADDLDGDLDTWLELEPDEDAGTAFDIGAGLDLDLDLGGGDGAAAPHSVELPDLEFDEIDQPVDASAEASNAGASEELVIDFGDPAIAGETSPAAVAEDSAGGLEADLEQSLLDLTGDFDGSDGSESDGEEEELVFATDGDEISTKLDLARAYIDMGDDEGAKGILEEVLRDGSDAQRQEARALIENLD